MFKKRNDVANCLSDTCDGSFFKEHPLFGSDDGALQLLIYYDDVESANPLGSYRVKHKLGMFPRGGSRILEGRQRNTWLNGHSEGEGVGLLIFLTMSDIFPMAPLDPPPNKHNRN